MSSSSRISGYQGYDIIGLALDLRQYLDESVFNRLVYGGLDGISRAEAEDIADQLYALKRKVLRGSSR